MRVIDAGTNIAAPYAASILSGLGAEVVKVEPLAGDPMRALPPFADGIGSAFAATNHGKRYISLDLHAPRGREVMRRLAGRADALVQNIRPRREAALGLDAASLHATNPRLVHAKVEAFYPSDGQRPGYDLLIQAESGLIDLNGEASRPPARIPAAAIDHATGTWLALGILAALDRPRAAATVRVSMLDVAIGLLNERVSAFLTSGERPRRMGSGTANTTPHGAYPTADAYIVIGAATDAAFARLADVLGGSLAADPRYGSQAGRLGHREELDREIIAALAGHGADHWVAALTRADVPVARVATLPEAVERHAAASPTGVRAPGSPGAPPVLALPLRLGEAGDDAPLPPPGGIGRDSAEILAELGYGAAEIAELLEREIVRG